MNVYIDKEYTLSEDHFSHSGINLTNVYKILTEESFTSNKTAVESAACL